jgi:hypothetical protein
MQTRYDGVDWRIKSTWGCNDAQDPFDARAYDMFTLSPLDLMFVPFQSTAKVIQPWSLRHSTLLEAWNVDGPTVSGLPLGADLYSRSFTVIFRSCFASTAFVGS